MAAGNRAEASVYPETLQGRGAWAGAGGWSHEPAGSIWGTVGSTVHRGGEAEKFPV